MSSRALLPALLILGLVLLVSWASWRGAGGRCWFAESTGLYCAGCGGTRAARALFGMDLPEALRNNALLVIGLLGGTVVLVGRLVRHRFRAGRENVVSSVSGRWLWWVLVVVVVFWIARNIPAEPFRWLAPPSG